MTIELIISEPWDFVTSQGDNHLTVKVLERLSASILVEPLSDYAGKTEQLILETRDSFGHVNIFNHNDEGIKSLIMIGTLLDKNQIKLWQK